MISLVDVLTRTEAWFRTREISSPRLEAELILCHVLDLTRVQVYLAYDRPLNDAELTQIRALVKRRGTREPLAWILGNKPFHAINLQVEPGVLVPRPDTETLVEAALELIDADPAESVFVADVGTGSGAVGLAIAAARPTVRVYATDVSEQALAVAKKNVALLKLGDRVAVLRGSLLEPIPANRHIDWVVSNPPYIPSRQIERLEPEVSKFEPRLALDGGPDGLNVYRALIPAAAARARKGILVEVGHDQAARVATLMRKAGLREPRVFDDLAGIGRVVAAKIAT